MEDESLLQKLLPIGEICKPAQGRQGFTGIINDSAPERDLHRVALRLLDCLPPVPTRINTESAATRLDARGFSAMQVGLLPSFALGFVREQVDTVLAIARLVRRDQWSQSDRRNEESW